MHARARCSPAQKFAESLLEVADNLESAAKAVPGDVLAPGADVPADKALGLLRALLEGVNATERVLLKVAWQGLLGVRGGRQVLRVRCAQRPFGSRVAAAAACWPADDGEQGRDARRRVGGRRV